MDGAAAAVSNDEVDSAGDMRRIAFQCNEERMKGIEVSSNKRDGLICKRNYMLLWMDPVHFCKLSHDLEHPLYICWRPDTVDHDA